MLIMINSMVAKLIEKGMLSDEQKEDYVYGLTIVCEKWIVYSILFLIAIFLRHPIEGMIFATAFVSLRQTTGGFHANNFLGCLIGSIVTFFLVIQVGVPLLIKYRIISFLLVVISTICILVLSPINHPNLALTGDETRKIKQWNRKVLCIELLTVGIGSWLQMCWQQYIIAAIVMCAVFIILAKIIGQEVKDDEE